MNAKSIKNKCISLVIIVLLLISFNSFNSISAKPTRMEDDGIWYDDFDVPYNEYEYDNCGNYNGSIKLNEGEPSFIYDYEEASDKMDVWIYNNTPIPTSTLGSILSKYVKPDLLQGDPAGKNEKEAIAKLDDGEWIENYGIFYPIETDLIKCPLHRFQFKISENRENIKSIGIQWYFGDYFKDANLEEISMYVWEDRELLPKWTEVESKKYNESNIVPGESSLGTIGNILESSGSIISEEGYVDILIIGNPDLSIANIEEKGFYLHSDYIELTVNTKYGYLPEGTLISTPITINDNKIWENVFWSGSKSSTSSSINIEVLDSTGEPIEGFSGDTSPIDISRIKQNTIRLKVTLKTSSKDITPRLDSWGVLWQTTGGYKDNFSFNFRIDESKGTLLENNQTKVSSYFSDWSIFGKSSNNTRSYDGKTISTVPSKYWYTNETLGGGFRSPITSEGKVYIASKKDKCIYAFEIATDDKGKKQHPIDVSKEKYIVDSALAVSDDYIIVPTSNSDGKNQIFCLDKNNLSSEIWSYSPAKTDICFSAAPNIYEDKVFITAWSGNILDVPWLSFLNKIVNRNNYFIGLDIHSGELIWESPIKLPAPSFSTPAVADGKVFVGCQNNDGSSLFAYDIESGEQVWNTSVGMIGKSSPAYADGKIFVLTSVNYSFLEPGLNKLFAVNAENGDVLWNISIGQTEKTFLLNLIWGSSYYEAISGYAPISTPAISDNTLFVLSPNGTFLSLELNGTVKWSYDFASEELLGFMTPYITSPIVIDNLVYVVTGFGNVYAFTTEQSSIEVEPFWTFEMKVPGYYEPAPSPDIITSPIVADGLLFITSVEEKSDLDLTGRLYCYGEYKPNSFGYLISNKIHLPEQKWWNTFTAKTTKTNNNSLSFSILKGNCERIEDFQDLNGSNNNISGLNTNIIRLYGELNINNYEEADPVLDSWEISWVPEEAPPEFITTGQKAWVNPNLQTFSIEVKDTDDNGVLSGIDTSSAQFKLTYLKEGSTTPTNTGWHDASCVPNISGVQNTRIIADFSSLNIDFADLINVTFSIRDLAGNENSSILTFDTDIGEPYSRITNIDDLEDECYTESIIISATAEDTGENGKNISGISKVSLKYCYRNSSDAEWNDWNYSSDNSNLSATDEYHWEFEPSLSGYYRVTTIAKDIAGNIEDIDNDNIATFTFDMTPPWFENDFEERYIARTIPSFDLNIKDDFIIKGLYYKLGSDVGWTTIKSDIESSTYSKKWNIPEEIWADIQENETITLLFRITDKCGNEYITGQNEPLEITKDEKISEFYLDLTEFSDVQWDDTFNIKANIPNYVTVEKVQLFYSYSQDEQSWSDFKPFGENITEEPYAWEFKAEKGNGFYKFYAKINDAAGYAYTSSSEKVSVSIIPLSPVLLLILLIIIFLIVTLGVTRKIKKKEV